MLYSPGRLRPRPRVPTDQLHHAAAVRLRAGTSAKGRLGEQQQQEEEGGQEREPREQHHHGPEGADEQSSDCFVIMFLQGAKAVSSHVLDLLTESHDLHQDSCGPNCEFDSF